MAVTNYTTIKRVRKEASGAKPSREWREKIGVGTGSKLVFDLGFAGGEKQHFVTSRDELGSVGEDDVDVFLNDSTTREASSNYTLDEVEGTITFNTPPTDAYNVHCTYWHNVISDEEISTICIPYAMDMIDRETDMSFYTDGDSYESETDNFDGDGVREEFYLSKHKVIAVTSYSIDAITSGLTENTDYYLYPKSNRIAFETPPANDRKNVQVTYTYGVPINQTVKDLADAIAAIKAISIITSRSGKTGKTTGTGSKRGYRDSNRPVTKTKLLRERIDDNFKRLGVKVKVAVV
jgi:hypothetical protein